MNKANVREALDLLSRARTLLKKEGLDPVLRDLTPPGRPQPLSYSPFWCLERYCEEALDAKPVLLPWGPLGKKPGDLFAPFLGGTVYVWPSATGRWFAEFRPHGAPLRGVNKESRELAQAWCAGEVLAHLNAMSSEVPNE